MSLAPIIDRVRAGIPALRVVGGASALDAALRGTLVAPAAFVIPLAERGEERPTTAVVSQSLTNLFAVILAVENVRGLADAAGLDELWPLREQLKNVLVGWVPDPDNGEPFIFTSGELVEAKGDGRLWWADEFQLRSYFRSQN